MIQVGPIVMPCCTCNVKPGVPCEWASGPRDPGFDFHARRVRDAATASDLIADLPSSPSPNDMLRRIAAQVDLTDPHDPIGIAMTRAGCADVTYGPDDVDPLHSMDQLDQP